MTGFYCISSFRKRMSAMLAVRKGAYAGVDAAVKQSFERCDFGHIIANRDMVLMQDAVVVIKLRMPDKKHRLSKKDGYRLIYLANKRTEEVVFLDIYAKNGPLQRLSVDDNELLALLEEYADEKELNLLQEYEF